jgi:20S proteasome subunit beta 7
MEHHPAKWGQPRAYGAATAAPITHHGGPIVTGTSVLAVKYNGGVLMAADSLASYGSLARFRGQQRLAPLSKDTLLGTSGDIADLQGTLKSLRATRREEQCLADGHGLGPRQWLTLLNAHMYARRSKMEPLWNSHVVAGVDGASGAIVLGATDHLGTLWEASSIATGYGAYIAQPLLRDAVEA